MSVSVGSSSGSGSPSPEEVSSLLPLRHSDDGRAEDPPLAYPSSSFSSSSSSTSSSSHCCQLVQSSCHGCYAQMACALLLLLLMASLYVCLHSADVFLTSDDFPVAWDCPPPLPSSPFPPSRVLIVTTDDRPLPSPFALPSDVASWPYYVLTHYINARYAARHAYTHQRITQPMASSRDVVWGKVYHLLYSLDWAAYDYIVAVDSDAWFSHVHLPLHDVLSCFAPDALLPSSSNRTPHLLFSLDYPVVHSRVRDLNAGVFIARTTDRARAILQLWWQLAEVPQHAHLQSEWPAEQGVLNELLMPNVSIAADVRVLPRQVIYGHAAAYINHVTSWWPKQRGWKGRREQLIMQDIVRGDIVDTIDHWLNLTTVQARST